MLEVADGGAGDREVGSGKLKSVDAVSDRGAGGELTCVSDERPEPMAETDADADAGADAWEVDLVDLVDMVAMVAMEEDGGGGAGGDACLDIFAGVGNRPGYHLNMYHTGRLENVVR